MGKIANGDFDPDAWDELLQLFGREGVGEMIETLQRDLPLQREQLIAAQGSEDRPALRRVAHNLRGVALQFGAMSLAQHCGEIEQSITDKVPTAQISAATARMLEQYADLLHGLQEALHDA